MHWGQGQCLPVTRAVGKGRQTTRACRMQPSRCLRSTICCLCCLWLMSASCIVLCAVRGAPCSTSSCVLSASWISAASYLSYQLLMEQQHARVSSIHLTQGNTNWSMSHSPSLKACVDRDNKDISIYVSFMSQLWHQCLRTWTAVGSEALGATISPSPVSQSRYR